MAVEEVQSDVVVIGHGIAGMSSAVSAMQNGAKVAVLERAPVEERGGNTRYTEAFLRLKNENELLDDFEDLLAEVSSTNPDPELVHATSGPYEQWPSIVRSLSMTDPEVIRTFADSTIPTIQWLKTFGLEFIPNIRPHITHREDPALTSPSGGGLAMIEALTKAAEEGGVRFFYETAARGLIQDDAGAVVGVRAVGRRNKRLDFRGRAVVLACGGFEGNPEMLMRYMGTGIVNVRPMARSGHYNRGEGVRMALDIGAAPAGDYGGYHANPIDPRSSVAEARVLLFPYGVLVNKLGLRFSDEGFTDQYRIYDGTAHAIEDEPDGVAYSILDARIDDIEDYMKGINSDKPAIMADSLDEMAEKLGLPAEAFEKTLADYNAACRPGKFKPERADGLATAEGLEPPKSNWARPVDRPPFMCWPIMSGMIYTYGGLKVTPKAQVVNQDGEVIPGLYAAGETIGLYYRYSAGATSVLRGAVFGRIAGADAAQLQVP
jgi:tricarballylate dehydrogenase